MKTLSLVALIVLLAFAGCSREEPETAVTETVDEEVIVESTDVAAPDEASADEPVEVVEESAAEVVEDSSNQPILLATTETPTSTREWKFKEGKNFIRLIPTQPTVGGADKIEVAEFFWYGCAHCYNFEPAINRWIANKPANVRFVRIPATWNQLVMLHAKLFYTEEVLVKNGKIANPADFRAAIFQEYHQRGNRMTSEESIQNLFVRLGVSADDFSNTWNSFEVAQKLRVAQDLARRYSISSVPMMVVNGKYRTGAAEAGGYPALIEVINELVERETLR